ncbi:hypothetical protein HF086_003109 [Spodoptera exigua]|uniref:HAT C-terminal dimerisation domain-containing protein n=1 Tax=Spodoptera exigua TaxID=7107 RepID=A0A922MWY0_SPOEX|nr:hypothetical protein HF086_003109 [Spodoptera exigua]
MKENTIDKNIIPKYSLRTNNSMPYASAIELTTYHWVSICGVSLWSLWSKVSLWYNTEINVLNTESTILDPRFKQKGFRDQKLCDKVIQQLKLKIGRVSSIPSRTTATSEPVIPGPSTSETSIWFDFDQEVARQTPENPMAAGIVELDKYLQEPLLKRTEDPLKWWHAKKNIYPLLFNYVIKRLNLVATSVPCERIFSKAGYTPNERRRRLTTKKLSQLLFISCNSE